MGDERKMYSPKRFRGGRDEIDILVTGTMTHNLDWPETMDERRAKGILMRSSFRGTFGMLANDV